MTCARRPAGARKPAPSAGSPRKPEPRTGRRRARLSRLLPALALLPGALALFAAAPAAAGTLVSNFGQQFNGANIPFVRSVHAQGFTTGSAAAGYILKSIEMRMAVSVAPTSEQVATFRAELWSDSSGDPGSKLASLTVPSTIAKGSSVDVEFTAPANTSLAANTAYHLVVYTTGNLASVRPHNALGGGEDPGGLAGWSISDNGRHKTQNTPTGSTWNNLNVPIKIRVNDASSRPEPPKDLRVKVGDTQLTLSWRAASGLVRPTGYDVHYTSSTAADDAVATGSDPAAAWVAATRSATDTAASQTISSLINDTAYRVRVRARNVDASAWVHGTGTPVTQFAEAPADLRTDSLSGYGELSLSWTAPPGTVTGYQVHYTSAAPADVASDAAVQTGSSPSAADGWVAVARTLTDTRASQVIPGLTGGTAYRVRVRAVNAIGPGQWAFGRGVPQAVPASVAWSATLNVKDLTNSIDNGCDNSKNAAAEKCSTATTLTEDEFTAGGAAYAITKIVVSSSGYFQMTFTGTLNAASRALKFCVGTTAFALSSNDVQQSGTSLRWSPGDSVSLSIASSCEAPAPPVFPDQTPALGGLTLSAGGEPVTLLQGRINSSRNTGFASSTQRYMAVVPYGTTQVAVTAEWSEALGQAASYRRSAAGDTTFSPARDLQSGNSFTVRLAPSEENGVPLPLWKRHTEVLVRVYRNHSYEPHTKLEYTYSVLIVQGGPIPVDLSVEGLTGNVLPNGGTATLKATIPVPLPMDSTIPLTVGYAEAQKGDVLFRPNPDHPNAYYGLDRPVDIFMRRGETEASIEIVSQPDPDRTSNELLIIELDSSGFPVAGSTRWGSNAVEVAPWTLTEGSSTSPTLSLGAAMLSTEPRVVGITAELFALIQKIEGWRDDPALSGHRPHVMRWNRVLLALGWSTVTPASDASLEPMSAAEAQTYADRGWTRWVEVAEALRELEPVAVTIAGGDPVTEGEAAAFTLTVSRARAADLAVAVSVENVRGRGAFAAAPGTRTVTVPAGSTSAAFTVATVDDAEDEADGWVVATLAADRGYTLGDPARAEVAVADNDAPDPVVTIAGGAPVTEGAAAGFTLTASPTPLADLAVAVSVSQSGAFADASALGARTVTIPAGGTSAAFTVATVDDAEDEADGAVVATLAAGSGYTLGEAARARVAVADNDEGLPEIVTSRSTAREGTDEAVVFTVRLGRAASHAVTVDWATADGAGRWMGFAAPARAGADYTASSGTLTFAAGQTFGSVRVPIIDDAIDEGMEYFLLRFSNPQGATLAAGEREVQGLIRNSDPLQAMWLARFGRMVASDAVASVTARLETPRDAGSHVTVAGQRMTFGEGGGGAALATVLTGFAQTFGAPSAPAADDDDPFARRGLTGGWNDPATATGARRVTARELLLGTSFRAVLGQGAGSQWTSWGQGASVSQFSAAVPGLGLTGESATGSMGMDYERGRLLMGFAMTHSVGEGTASDAHWRYALGSTATMALPYARLALSDRVSVWGLAGTGSGRLSLDLDGAVPQSYRTDLSMTLAATGVRGDLVTPAEAGGFALALKADAFWVRAESDRVSVSEFGSLAGARGESSRVRAVLDGSRAFSFASGAALTPSVELGVRHDAGDAETGTGLEVGAGLGYADPSRGLDMALRVHGLAVHAADGYDEWGVSGQLRLVPGGAGRGLSMSLTPSYGVDPAGSERLWALPASSGLTANGEAEPSSRFDAEVGYGMALPGDRFTGTPNVGFGLSDTARDYRIGWRLTSAVRGDPGFEVSLDATRREAANDNEAEHRVMLRSLVRW